MKSTGIVRKVDELGRIVLPIELRRTLDIGEKDALEIYVEGSTVMLKKFRPTCVFCDSAKDVQVSRERTSVRSACGNCGANKKPQKGGCDHPPFCCLQNVYLSSAKSACAAESDSV